MNRGQAAEPNSVPTKLIIIIIIYILSPRVSAFPSFQPELPVPVRPSRSRPEQNIDPGKFHRFTSNTGIAPLIILVGTGKLPRVLWCQLHDIWFLVQLTVNIFIFYFELLRAELHLLQNRQENAIIWCILVIVTMLLNISCVI